MHSVTDGFVGIRERPSLDLASSPADTRSRAGHVVVIEGNRGEQPLDATALDERATVLGRPAEREDRGAARLELDEDEDDTDHEEHDRDGQHTPVATGQRGQLTVEERVVDQPGVTPHQGERGLNGDDHTAREQREPEDQAE